MLNEKFIWQKDDIELVNESEFNQNATLYSANIEKPFSVCSLCASCVLCDIDDKNIGNKLATKIYDSYFRENRKDFGLVEQVINNYVSLCRKLLPKDIVLTKQIYCCSKMQLIELLKSNNQCSEDEIRKII